jgi:hypothetical protein
MNEERPENMDVTDESRPEAGGSAPDAEPSGDTEDADPLADADTAPGGDPAEAMPVKAEPGERSRGTSESGAPGIPPPVREDRLTPEGLPPTTTTGDPDKDYRGPSVTDTAREQMRDEPALDEPGYADLGHAEDYDVLRRED